MMKKPLTPFILMTVSGFLIGWDAAPPLFAWFVAGFDGFFRVSDPGAWTSVYLRFAFGAAALFAAQMWVARIAHGPAPSSPVVLVCLLIGVIATVGAAIAWHLWIVDARRDIFRYDHILPPRPGDLPCVSMPVTGLVASLCTALLYRWWRWLCRLFDGVFRHRDFGTRYDY